MSLAYVQLEQAWRFQELLEEPGYLTECVKAVADEVRLAGSLMVEIDRGESSTNLLYLLAAQGVHSEVLYPGGRLSARLTARKEAVAS